ncbi:hypothetical protein AMTR_s00075p00120890 [Amborella trichopoda]|uniref:Uncharacterized protein n=1 Tax=Amborella trichopoda TaxID=13333 RepID=W1PA76_AMBTC|nr:hypothetical protein AMTR_s00075p00120890 [Amborella trichopoda]
MRKREGKSAAKGRSVWQCKGCTARQKEEARHEAKDARRCERKKRATKQSTRHGKRKKPTVK